MVVAEEAVIVVAVVEAEAAIVVAAAVVDGIAETVAIAVATGTGTELIRTQVNLRARNESSALFVCLA